MWNTTVLVVQRIAFAAGIASSIVGYVLPSIAHETNFVCWGCMFLMCAPLLIDKK